MSLNAMAARRLGYPALGDPVAVPNGGEGCRLAMTSPAIWASLANPPRAAAELREVITARTRVLGTDEPATLTARWQSW
jgi:hypothetical protein